MHLNIYSLKFKVDRLQVFLEKEKPNIVCITEHHLKDQERKTINWEKFYEGSIFCRKLRLMVEQLSMSTQVSRVRR